MEYQLLDNKTGIAITQPDIASIGVIIVAAGYSQRMATDDSPPIDKIFVDLLGQPLIAHTISVFEHCPHIGEIVLVLSSNKMSEGISLKNNGSWSKLRHICTGGATRSDSVKAGLRQLSKCDLVIIHDGARPCVNQETILNGINLALKYGAAIPVVAVTDTIKAISSNDTIETTVPRDKLRAAQTPQTFTYDLIKKAYDGLSEGITDDSSLIEQLGITVKIYEGSTDNIKVTNRLDLSVAAMIIAKNSSLTQEQ